MGYRTKFKITASGDEKQLAEFKLGMRWKELQNLAARDWPDDLSFKDVKEAAGKIDDRGGCIGAAWETFSEGMKWYSFDKDMRALSNKFPGLMFEVEVNGEEQGDRWKMYVQAGKAQMCKATIVFPPFDAKEMK